ncbi:MAG: Gfo/Idh/MocA family oxidoreductase [Gemmatimonadota bacterium]
MDTGRSFAEECGIPRHHGSYDDLVADDDIDAVYIPLPNRYHAEWAIRAAQAGKHVLCEKPLAMNAEECHAMAEAAQEAGVVLMEAFMYRFHPRTTRVMERLSEGAVGELRTLRSAFTFRLRHPFNIRLNPELGGGALMDVGCYCVNVSRTLTGAEPVAAQATARWTGDQPGEGVDDELTGVLHFPGGVTAHFDCALTQERREFYEAQGTEGYLRVESAFLPGTGDVVLEEHRGGDVTEHPVDGDDEYRLMVEHFMECVRTGATPRWPASEAAANMKAIQALYRSARSGGVPVELE